MFYYTFLFVKKLQLDFKMLLLLSDGGLCMFYVAYSEHWKRLSACVFNFFFKFCKLAKYIKVNACMIPMIIVAAHRECDQSNC